jgi:hypothetical protein
MNLKHFIALVIATGINALILPLVMGEEPPLFYPHAFKPYNLSDSKSDQINASAIKLLGTFVSLDYNNATITEGLFYLKAKSKELDPDHIGVTFVIEPGASSSARPITLALNNVPLGVALKYVCKLAHVKADVQDDAIHILASSDNTDAVIDPYFLPPSSSFPMHEENMKEWLRQRFIIDTVNFDHLDIATAMQFLAAKSKEVDLDKRGVNFVLGPISPQDQVHRAISMTYKNVRLIDLIDAIAKQANLKYSLDDGLVYFHP